MQARGRLLGRIAHPQIGAPLRHGVESDLTYTGLGAERQPDDHLIAIGFDAPEVLVVLGRTWREAGPAERDRMRLGREAKLVAVHVITIRDPIPDLEVRRVH